MAATLVLGLYTFPPVVERGMTVGNRPSAVTVGSLLMDSTAAKTGRSFPIASGTRLRATRLFYFSFRGRIATAECGEMACGIPLPLSWHYDAKVHDSTRVSRLISRLVTPE